MIPIDRVELFLKSNRNERFALGDVMTRLNLTLSEATSSLRQLSARRLIDRELDTERNKSVYWWKYD